MITEWWSTLTPATQIQYWGYICFILGCATIEIVDYVGPYIVRWLEAQHGAH